MIKKWWMESTCYQIYPKSFMDSDNDGIGDLKGITQKLGYLEDLGIDLIWICPFFESPMIDNGYDISNFKKVDKLFGTTGDLEELIRKAHSLNIRVIFDLVLNHTSDLHPWFIESRKTPDNKYRDYYIWAKGKIKDGTEYPPCNWNSFFGGSCFKKDELTGEYYMHIFSDKMPDLNWKNKAVRDELKKIAEYYLSLGADGFRIDAVSHLAREKFEDVTFIPGVYGIDIAKYSNLPEVHGYLKEFNKDVFINHDILTIGEVGGGAGIEEALKYSSFVSEEINMVFNFDHNWHNNIHNVSDSDDIVVFFKNLRLSIDKWQKAFLNKGWLPLNWLNHDQPRLMTQYGSKKYPLKSAKLLAGMMYFLRGTPFIYQGEELGMTNYPHESIDDFHDVTTINRYYEEIRNNAHIKECELIKKISLVSRDNGRTPMQWNSLRNAGFTEGIPWLKVNPNYKSVNAEDELRDKSSILNYYKKIIKLRKSSEYKDVLVYGNYSFIDTESDKLYNYLREDKIKKLLMVNSYSDYEENFNLNELKFKKIILNNYDTLNIKNNIITLSPYQSVLIELEK